MPVIVPKIIMWIAWLFTTLLAVLMGHFTTAGISKLNSFARPADIFAVGMFLLPIVLCVGLRFWLSRIRNPWVALLPFLLGVFFAWQAGLYGIFLIPEFCIVFQVLSAILFFLYLPILAPLCQSPPPLPIAKA